MIDRGDDVDVVDDRVGDREANEVDRVSLVERLHMTSATASPKSLHQRDWPRAWPDDSET